MFGHFVEEAAHDDQAIRSTIQREHGIAPHLTAQALNLSRGYVRQVGHYEVKGAADFLE